MNPMLAFKLEAVEKARLPVLLSPKLDGIRCMIYGGVPRTRSLKDIPNLYVRNALKAARLPHGMDGELVVGPANDKDVYRTTSSGIMSQDGEPDWCFHVFDLYDDQLPFSERLAAAGKHVKAMKNPRIKIVEHTLCRTAAEIDDMEAVYLSTGYEGAMGRALTGYYKCGRSGKSDMALWKLKRFEDAEAMIIGFEEQMHNANPAKRDRLGRTERSSHKAGLVPAGTLGALNVRGMSDQFGGVEFDIGTGLSDYERALIWENRDEWMGKVVKYKFMPIGVKDKPRFPVYLGLRGDL
jgi:DNA ligase-1